MVTEQQQQPKQQAPSSPPQPISRGLEVPCPECDETNGVAVFVDDTTAFYCNHCEKQFEREAVDELIETMTEYVANWRRVLAWIDTAPEPERSEGE